MVYILTFILMLRMTNVLKMFYSKNGGELLEYIAVLMEKIITRLRKKH